ncbi:small membrane A-kinase anchor protein isoform X1 [Sphaerodactylus townsendi]|uniref:small membrane A-kinase anchor protein isoform X1 n=1 Tax=Sphaerodactylus townsendi TaxID=933632 RepID=UPI002026146A|nr:small membrane A-kinase anchor protein isoform X1 [Sphaerodactylus townsendi]
MQTLRDFLSFGSQPKCLGAGHVPSFQVVYLKDRLLPYIPAWESKSQGKALLAKEAHLVGIQTWSSASHSLNHEEEYASGRILIGVVSRERQIAVTSS